MRGAGWAALVVAGWALGPVVAQEKGQPRPLLRLEAGGPTGNVTALAWSADGRTLFAAGFDKVVRAWSRDAQGRWATDDTAAFRVPIGPGLDGAINAMTVSPDGRWLAVGGLGLLREGMTFHDPGRLVPVKGTLTPAMRQDRGQIWVFDVRTRAAKELRGHTGTVVGLTFAHGSDAAPKLLSVAEGWDSAAAKTTGEVKVWDVAGAKAMETATFPPLQGGNRPGLGLWASGGGLGAVLAWGDGKRYRWQTGGAWTEQLAGKMNLGLAVASDRSALLTSEFRDGAGRIARTPLAGGAGVEFPTAGAAGLFPLPVTLAWLPRTDLAAAVVAVHPPYDNELLVFDARAESFGAGLRRFPLVAANRNLPVMAASPDGQTLALGGFPDHRIRLFGVAALAQGRAEMQLLGSVGDAVRTVRFVKQGDALGVAFATAKEEAVLDLTKRQLGPVAGWADDNAPAGGLTTTVDGKTVRLARGGQPIGQATLRDGAVTATATLDRADGPFLAIASYLPARGTVVLELHHGPSGVAVRRFAGHLAPVRGLAFKADGKLLASASEDQTVSVWSLNDLDEVLGRRGGLGEMALETRDGALVVVQTGDFPRLAEGDVVSTVTGTSGKKYALKGPQELHDRAWMRKPGDLLAIETARGVAVQEVKLTLKQGVDVRKPLFSLFFPRGADGKLGDWLGWNAIGPYDASRREAEKHLGWHFNTGNPDQPASFARIDQYRKEYYREGLLDAAARLGDLPPPPKPPAPKPVVLLPTIAQDGKTLERVGDEFRIGKRDFALHVTLVGYDPLPGDALAWRFEESPKTQPFAEIDGARASAPTTLPPGPARRRIVVTLMRHPDGWPAQAFEATAHVRYRAPAPSVSAPQTQGLYLKTQEPAFAFKAKAAPGEPGAEFRLSVVHETEGKAAQTVDLGKHAGPVEREAPLTLAPGFNFVTLSAVSASDPDASTSATLMVLLERKRNPPPAIGLELPGGPVGPGRPLETQQATFALKGRIAAQGEGLAAELTVGKTTRPLALDAEGRFALELPLAPGPQTVTLSAKTKDGERATLSQAILYRPALPTVTLATPEEQFSVVGAGPRGTTAVDVRLAAPEKTPAYPIVVEATATGPDGKVVDRKETRLMSDADRATFADLGLAPGANVVAVTVRHAWNETTTLEARGRFVRPPTLAGVKVDGEGPFVTLTATVASASPPLENQTRVSVNGRLARFGDAKIEKGPAADAWTVTVSRVPLVGAKGKETRNDLRLSLATAEGDAAVDAPPVVFRVPPPPLADITLVEPALREATLAEPKTRLAFRVRSESDVDRVEIARGDTVLKRWEKPVKNAEGVWELELADVALDWGITNVSLRATNEGGVRETGLTLNVPAQPVRLEVDQVQIPGFAQKWTPDALGELPALPLGRVVVRGSVRWSSRDDALVLAAKQVRVFVNGFQQAPATLKAPAPGSRVRTFETPIVLGFADNALEFELGELKQDASNRVRFAVPCREPVRGQHLHVLVVAPAERDEAALVDNLARSLKAKKTAPNLYQTPLFDQVRFYVLSRHVQLLEIASRLDRIGEGLQDRAKAGSPNDLVLVYYQGKESASPFGPVLATSESASWLQLSMKDLSNNYLGRFSGGQVVILDTLNPGDKVGLADYRFAFLRRPDPRPWQTEVRERLSAEIAKDAPSAVWLDRIADSLSTRIGPTMQTYVPERMRNRIQFHPE